MQRSNPISFLFSFYVSVIITNFRLLNFIIDHRARMFAANGSGLYTVYIAALDLLIISFRNAISSTAETIALQVGDTEVLDGGVVDFSEFAHAEEPHIRYLFRDDHSAYIEFYLHGLSPLNHMTRTNSRELMFNYWKAADHHSGIVGAPFVATCLGFVTDFDNNRDNQVGKFASVNIIRNLIRVQRTEVVQQLIRDSGGILINNSTDGIAAKGFFNFPLLYRIRTVDHVHLPDDGSYIVTPPFTHANAGEIILDGGTMIRGENDSDGELWIYISELANGAPGELFMIVPPRSTRAKLAPLVGDISHHFINGFINNLTIPGRWRVDVYDA